LKNASFMRSLRHEPSGVAKQVRVWETEKGISPDRFPLNRRVY